MLFKTNLIVSIIGLTSSDGIILILLSGKMACNEISRVIFLCVKKRRWILEFIPVVVNVISDSDNDLNQLIACFANKRASIELIKYNTIIENDIYKASEPEVFQRFYTELNKNGIETIIEENVGIELKAGCGQLIWKYSEVTTNENMFSIRKNTTTEANGNY